MMSRHELLGLLAQVLISSTAVKVCVLFVVSLSQVYSSRIAALESRVLLDSRPRASLTKELHLLSNDLKRE